MKVYFFIVGILILCLGLYLLYRRLSFLKKSQLTEGQIISYEARKIKQGYVYHPIVSFNLEQAVYTFISPAARGWKQYPEGHLVPVRYLPEKPQEAFINSFLHFWAAPLGCMVLGCAGIAVMFVK